MRETNDVRPAPSQCLRGVSAVRALAFGICLAALAPGGAAATEPAPRTISIELAAPLPAVSAAAQEAGIPTDRHIVMVTRPQLRAGDFVTAVVSVREGPALTQWIVKLTADDLTPAEQALPPLKEVDAYTSFGSHLHFAGQRAAIEVELIGPVTGGTSDVGHPRPAAAHLRKRLLVNADYLALGLDRTCEAMLRLREAALRARAGEKFDWAVGAKPFSSDRVRAAAPFAREIGLTPEWERAMVGTVLALPEYLQLIIRTPGLQDIFQQVVDVSWWSIIRKGGKLKPGYQPNLRAISRLPPAATGRPQHYEFPLTFTLNGKPALACRLVVMEPRPPIAVCAGVVEVRACRPDGAGPQLTIELLAARPAEAAKPANPPGPADEEQAAH